ncbi:hypothetical protein [Aquimarina sp. I32.4]|uniref:hypothetical protein n=1 Tax=Aquimarina sp. I32.4 TaxID=2053903 RepID=UPI000CDECE8E|nr:hypothetical protein [Aquimarina sp. I32.4]
MKSLKYLLWTATGLILFFMYAGTAFLKTPLFLISYCPALILTTILTYRVVIKKRNALLFLLYTHLVIFLTIIIVHFTFFKEENRNVIKSIANSTYFISMSNGYYDIIIYFLYIMIPFAIVISVVTFYMFKFSDGSDRIVVLLLGLITALCIHTSLFFLPYKTSLKNHVKNYKNTHQEYDKKQTAKTIDEIREYMNRMDTISFLSKEFKDSLEEKIDKLPYQNNYPTGEILLPNQLKEKIKKLEHLLLEKRELTSQLTYKENEINLLREIYYDFVQPIKCSHFKLLKTAPKSK